MINPVIRKMAVSFAVMTAAMLAGWNPSAIISNAYAANKPAMPVAMSIPSTPIVSGSGGLELGYLPGSGTVSQQGQYTYDIPLEVPPGRMGMKPSLSLDYNSAGGSGMLGVGWSLSGISTISRCSLTLSTDGATRGARLTDSTAQGSASDRFCLDGKKLVSINGPYGQIGTEYRTEEDNFMQVLSSLAPSSVAQAANEPMFTVRTRDGKTLVYTALYGTPVSTALHGPGSPSGTYKTAMGMQAIMSWALTSQTDVMGNGIQFHYCTVTTKATATTKTNDCPAASNPALDVASLPAWSASYPAPTQWKLSYIVYTTAADGSDAGERKIVFSYENLPSNVTPEYRFEAGVATGTFQRLSKITMFAPNPAAMLPVWQYDITYARSEFSNRSLLTEVKRCGLDSTKKDPSGGVEGGCTWAKQFSWTTTPTGPVPQWNVPQIQQAAGTPSDSTITMGGFFETDTSPALVQSGPIAELGSNNPPVLQVLDVDGDGKDDILLQYGGVGHPVMKLITTPNSAAGVATSFLTTGVDPMQTGDLLVSADDSGTQGGEYEALQNILPMDIDGDGSSEIFVTQATLTNQFVPTTDILISTCQPNIMHWDSVTQGFNKVTLDNPLAPYDCTYYTNAHKDDLFVDLDGDGRLDRIQSAPVNYTFQPSPDSSTQTILLPGPWRVSGLSTGTGMSGSRATLPGGTWSACPTFVVDFFGDGRGQLFGLNGYAFGPTSATPSTADNVICGGDTAFTTELDNYDPTSNQWKESTDYDPQTDQGNDLALNPKWPIIPATTYLPDPNQQAFPINATLAPGLGTAPTLIFGDFNGDGLEDVIEPDQDPANAGKGMFWLRWNTGNGFGPRIALPIQTWAMANPNAAQNSNYPDGTGYTPTFFRLFVSDLNHDGRADLIVFGNYPSAQTTLLLSNGDGTFNSSPIQLGFGSQAAVQEPAMFTNEGNWVVGVGDFNGDGYTDIAYVEPFDIPTWSSTMAMLNDTQTWQGRLMVSTQYPTIADRIQSVSDEPTVWPREQVTYSLAWSDKPEAVAPCTYPQRCQMRGSVVVREVDYRDTLANPTLTQVMAPHAVYYSYEDPVSDMRGRGALGFRKVRVWDPTQLSQTTTEYDNRTEAIVSGLLTQSGGNTYYPFAMRPKLITSVTAIPSSTTPQTAPVLTSDKSMITPNARVVQTSYTYQLVAVENGSTNAGLTYSVQPLQQTTSEWEQPVVMSLSIQHQGPTSDYVWSNGAPYTFTPPLNPLRVTTTQVGGVSSGTCNNGAAPTGVDLYGNVLQSTTSIRGGITRLDCATYVPAIATASTWQISLLQSSTTTQWEADPSIAPVKRGISYDYDPTTHLLAHEYQLQFASASDTQPSTLSTTTLTRDAYGNVISSAIQALGPEGQMDTRLVNIEYDPLWPGQPNERIFPSQHWVPVAYPGTSVLPSSWSVIHPAYGVTSAQMDINGVQQQTVYDDQGRPVQINSDGQASILINYTGREDNYGGYNGLVVTTSSAGQVVTETTDADGRSLSRSHLGFDGSLINDTYLTYDLLGRQVSASRPYAGSSPQAMSPANGPQSTFTYDGLNRLLTMVAPDSTVQQPVKTIVTPTFFTTTTQDPSGNQHQKTLDVNGRMIKSADFLSGKWVGTQYAYAPFGNLTSITDPGGNVETHSYDTLGRLTQTSSKDAGITTNILYDGFGDVLGHSHQPSGSKPSAPTDASTSYGYDSLGRQTSWSTLDGSTTTSATFTYDAQTHGLGRLATATSSDNVTTIAHYDASGRSSGTDEIVGGHTYTTSTIRNALGQVSQVNYPAIGSSLTPWITLPQTYTATGYLKEIDYSENGGAAAPVWRVMSRNLDDLPLQGEFGNNVTAYAGQGHPPKFAQAGVVVQNSYQSTNGRLQQIVATPTNSTAPILNLNYLYYPNGSVQSRIDLTVPGAGREERYTYDGLNRLTGWDLQTCAISPCISSAGTQQPLYAYGYDASGDLKSSSILVGVPGAWNYSALQTNTYGDNGAGPHALTTQAASSINTAYGYDSHGRQTSGADRKIAYNAFNLPRTVVTPSGSWTVIYDAFGHRVQKTATDGTTTVYIGGLYEKRATALGPVDVFHLPGGDLQYNESTQETSLYGQFTDALGSVGVVFNNSTGSYTGVPGSPGTTVSTFFYDPFGARITANGSAFVNTDKTNTQGFTGQEEDDEWGLINFRGRMYNPTLKRFLSPDPHVTSPGFSQSWNRYSYVNNNPLNFTDPTGFDGEGDGGSNAAANSAPIIYPKDGDSLPPWVPPGTQAYQDWHVVTDPNSGVSSINRGYIDALGITYSFGYLPDIGGLSVPSGVPAQSTDSSYTPSGYTPNATDGVSKSLQDWGNKLVENSEKPFNESIAGFLLGSAAHGVGSAIHILSHSVDKDADGWNYRQPTKQDAAEAVETLALAITVADGVSAASTAGRTAAEVEAASTLGCFVAGTLVQTPDGERTIESLKVGDLVTARDETTGKTTAKPILQLVHHENQRIEDLTLSDETGAQEQVQATPDHPFHVLSRGWVEAGHLHVGDRIERLHGDPLIVKDVRLDQKRYATFNFEVADLHTYFVGSLQAWVHNQTTCLIRHAEERVRFFEKAVMDGYERVQVATTNLIQTAELYEAEGIKLPFGQGPAYAALRAERDALFAASENLRNADAELFQLRARLSGPVPANDAPVNDNHLPILTAPPTLPGGLYPW